MALELTNTPLSGQYTVTGAGEPLGGKQVFSARDGVGQSVSLCVVSRSELAACSPIIGASQHPNVLPILDKVDDQGMVAVVLPDTGLSNVSPTSEDIYSIILQLIDASHWLSQRGFEITCLGQGAVALVDGRPVIKDYFVPPSTSGTSNDSALRNSVYAVSSWALMAVPELPQTEPELHHALSIGASFLPSDRWESLDVLAKEVLFAYKARNRKVVSATKSIAAIGAICGLLLLLFRELSWQLINGL